MIAILANLIGFLGTLTAIKTMTPRAIKLLSRPIVKEVATNQ
jgi:hypothetical protein